MERVTPNPPSQDHTQTYGQYCLGILTPEYRELVATSNADWKANRLRYLEDKEDLQSDIERMAIMEVLEPSA